MLLDLGQKGRRIVRFARGDRIVATKAVKDEVTGELRHGELRGTVEEARIWPVETYLVLWDDARIWPPSDSKYWRKLTLVELAAEIAGGSK